MASTHDSLPPTFTARHLLAQHARRAGVAVLVGAAFAGGALFARAQAGQQPAKVDDMIARAEERTERLEGVQEDLELRYHAELTAAAADPAGPTTKPAASVDPQGPATKPSDEAPSHGAAGETDPPVAAPVPKPEPKPEPELETVPEPTLAEPEHGDAENNRDRLAAAFADVMGEEAPTLTIDAPPPPADEAKGFVARPEGSTYTVQVGSFPSAESAGALVADYQRKGYDVRVASAKIGERTVHRVQVGDFGSREAAMDYRRDLEAKEGVLSLVVQR